MTPAALQKTKAFALTLVAFAAFAVLFKTVRLGHRIDAWKATIRAERRPLTYRERCDALDGVTVRLHDATAHEVYDELCLVPNP